MYPYLPCACVYMCVYVQLPFGPKQHIRNSDSFHQVYATFFILPGRYLCALRKKKKKFIFRGEGREEEGEKHQCVVASCTPPAGDLACNPGMCPDWELNQ